MKRIKVLMVAAIYTPPCCGAGYVTQLLKESRFAAEFEILHINAAFVNAVADLESVTVGKALRFVKYLGVLVWSLLTTRPDIVVLCPAFSRGAFFKDSIYTFVCARVFGRRVVWWCHAWGLTRLVEGAAPLLRRYIRWTVGSVTRVVTVGRRQQEDFASLCRPNSLTTVHSGVPATTFDVHRFERRASVRVLYFANLDATKGWRILLEAARRVCAARDAVLFDFFGNPAKNSGLAAITDAFAEGPFTDRIRYHGPAYGEAKRQAFDNADIFCFPTYFPVEVFPLVNIEAMNAGLPIVATRHACIAEAVADSLGGFLVPTRDVTALTDALLHLIDDPDLRMKMGVYNAQHFSDYFTVDGFADRSIHLMREVMACRES
jgi:glycosyltransferase involved in cell wall biosynthesis